MQKFKKLLRSIPRSLLFIIGGLIVLRLLLPFICLQGFNWALANKGQAYTGHLEDFDLSLYRGAYQLQGLVLKKRGTDLPPFLEVKEIDLSIAWRALFHGKILIDADIDSAVVRLIDGAKKENQQYGVEEDKQVQKDFADLVFPISIERLRVTKSAVYFTNYDFKKALPVSLEDVEFRVSDLRTQGMGHLSPFVAMATLQKHAKLAAQGSMDVLSARSQVDMDAQLTEFQINTVNDILRIYIPLDITRGTLDLYSELAMSQGKGNGYVNVFLNDADIISSKQDFISIKHFLFEIIAGVGNLILRNPKDNSLAFHMPFAFTEKKFEADGSYALGSMLRNRFGNLPRGIQKNVSLANKGKKTEAR